MSAKDISRFLFQPQKRYSSVRMQQGRVILDSDWNESERIDDEEARRTVVETVCAKGTPNEGFLVQEVTEATVTEPPAVGEEVPSSKATYDFALGSGSFYLGGLRFEIFTEIVADGPDLTERFLTQADWLQIDADLGNLPARPSVADLTNADGSFKVRHDLVYVRGWEQCVTAVEDSELRERALGGPDTSVRLRRMRRIEVLPEVDLDPARQDFCDASFAALKAQLTAPREGDLTDEHHLFDEANCELRSKAKLTITFGGEGITDDLCKPKVTAGFLGADNQTIRVQLTATNRFIWGYDNASPLYRVQVLEEAGQPVKIKFLTLPHDQVAQPLKGQAVEILPWGALLPNQEKVAELQGHLATVATSFNPEDKTMTISTPVPQAWIDWLHAPEHAQYLSDRDPDAKKKYFYLRLWTGGSGDADQPDHAFTPGTPVELLGTGLNVTFSKHGLPGDFWIIAARPNTPDLVAPWDLLKEAPPAGTRFFFAPLALVRWTVTIPPAGGEVGVHATVVDCRHTFRPLCEVDGGGCCVTVGTQGAFRRLDEAIQALRERGEHDLCLCLLPGNHEIPGLELDVPVGERELHLEITGCNLGSHLALQGPLRLRGVSAFTMRDVALDVRFAAEGEQGAMAFDRCAEVTIASCHISGFTTGGSGESKGALLSITHADRIVLRDNIVESALPDSLELIRHVFAAAGVDLLADLFGLPDQHGFDLRAFKFQALAATRKLVELNQDERQKIQQNIIEALPQFQTMLTQGERFSVLKLLIELSVAQPSLAVLFDTLMDIRRAAIKARPGVAIVLGARLVIAVSEGTALSSIDVDDYTTLESNTIIGILSLYGLPPTVNFVREVFNVDLFQLLQNQMNRGEILLRDGYGFLGTLQLRGNHLVRIAVAADLLEHIKQRVEAPGPPQQLFGLFNRCLASDNVIEGGSTWLVCVHQSMTGNAFTVTALDNQNFSDLGFVIADSAIYIGNHSDNPDRVLRDVSRISSEVATLDMTIA